MKHVSAGPLIECVSGVRRFLSTYRIGCALIATTLFGVAVVMILLLPQGRELQVSETGSFYVAGHEVHLPAVSAQSASAASSGSTGKGGEIEVGQTYVRFSSSPILRLSIRFYFYRADLCQESATNLLPTVVPVGK